MDKPSVIIAIPVAHTYFWQDSCLAQLLKYDPGVSNIKAAIVSNAFQWCPSIKNMIDLSINILCHGFP